MLPAAAGLAVYYQYLVRWAALVAAHESHQHDYEEQQQEKDQEWRGIPIRLNLSDHPKAGQKHFAHIAFLSS